MNLKNVDLNLLVYLNVLLEERNVSRAASKLALTQPTMSNALKRLRELFNDPLLVRTADGMRPTDKAEQLKPDIVAMLSMAEKITQPDRDFDPASSAQTFRILANDYVESCLLAPFIRQHLLESPQLNFDIISPADVSLTDMEKGTIDLAINRFVALPKSFHQASIWRDNFCCLVHESHPYAEQTSLDCYLASEHIWFNRPGWGAQAPASLGGGSHKLGWVDEALWQLDQIRKIRVFSRHYLMTPSLLEQGQLIATLPRRQAMLFKDQAGLRILRVPFQIVPIEVKMIWSPLLQHSQAHQWLRRSLVEFAASVADR